MIVLAVLLSLPAVVLCLPLLSDLISLTAGSGRRPSLQAADPGPAPRLLFLVLAHDEEMLIGPCVRSLLAQEYPEARRPVVVVADNCSDATAVRARDAGATVWERSDPTRRGKPYAIAWAIEKLDLLALDGVVIVDADTLVRPDFAAALAAMGPSRDRVLQPFIEVQNPTETALTRMAAVHGTAAHGIAYRVKERAGINVPLGVGMCIGADVLRAEPWSAFSIAEDYELYAILTARGVRIVPAPLARISAQEARSLGQSAPQRNRWMAGKLQVLLGYGGRVIRSRRITAAQRVAAIAELTGLGPATHLGFAIVGSVTSLLVLGGSGGVPAALYAVSLIRPIAYTMLAILSDPSPGRSLLAFAYLPIYASWRLAEAIKSMVRVRGDRWVRTDRHVSAVRNPSDER